MPDPSNVFGNEATKHLAALVRYWMQNYLLTTQWQYSLVACERDFNLVVQSLSKSFQARNKQAGTSMERRGKSVLMNSQLVPTSPRRKGKTQLIEVK